LGGDSTGLSQDIKEVEEKSRIQVLTNKKLT